MTACPRIANLAIGRDNNFNLIRILAATGVLVSHAYPISLGPTAVEPLQTWLHGRSLGNVCVLVFFALSGFFIAKSFDRRASWQQFIMARAFRLFPALLLILLITVLVAGLFLTQAPAQVFWAAVPDYILRHLTLYQPLYALPGVFDAVPYGPVINGSLWTLSYEVACYFGVFFAGLAGLLRHRIAFTIALAALTVLFTAVPLLPLPGRIDNLIGLAMPFATGTAFYVWQDKIPLSIFAALALSLITLLLHSTMVFAAFLVLSLSYWVFLLGLLPTSRLHLYNRLGDYSYGTYIFAFPIQQLVANSGTVDPIANMAFAIPATLLCAMLSWHLVERPALARVRR